MSNITLCPRNVDEEEASLSPSDERKRCCISAGVRLASSRSGRPSSLATLLYACSKRSMVSSDTEALSSFRPTLPDAVASSVFM